MFRCVKQLNHVKYLGGLIMVPVKHSNTKKFLYNSGFFITTNMYPDFGDGTYEEAIRKRLKVFHTIILPKKDGNASGISATTFLSQFSKKSFQGTHFLYLFSIALLRTNGMMVFHYVAIQLENVPIFESNTIQVDKNNSDVQFISSLIMSRFYCWKMLYEATPNHLIVMLFSITVQATKN